MTVQGDASAQGLTAQRLVVLWCPDWPVTAAIHAAAHGEGLAGKGADVAAGAAVALIVKGLVFASSAAARAEGVTRGLRVREAQARMPELTVLDYDPALDARAFEPIIAAVEELTPGVQLLRPGVCAVRVRGAARYYGGERAAALGLVGRMNELGAGGARAGVGDGLFTAEQAARRGSSGTPVVIVPEGESAAFLAPLDVGLLDEFAASASTARSQVGMVTLLRRLGIRTLGEFAALGADDVRNRFGGHGARLHALAAGSDSLPITPRTPPRDLDVSVDFEPALDRVDQVAFGVRAVADDFIERSPRRNWCAPRSGSSWTPTRGEFSERVWLHPRSFTAADVVDRVRWQVQASGDASEGTNAVRSGITRVRIVPEAVDAIGNHETGLWGSGPDERVHHALSRVQSMLGHGGVLMPVLTGGRTLADRQQLVAWGDRPVAGRDPSQPWPGRLPEPLPGTVFTQRHPVHVLSAAGEAVAMDARGALSAPPVAVLGRAAPSSTITQWAGPWPLDERWWSPEAARAAWRFQAVDSTGCAWLLVLDSGGWWAEARYD